MAEMTNSVSTVAVTMPPMIGGIFGGAGILGWYSLGVEDAARPFPQIIKIILVVFIMHKDALAIMAPLHDVMRGIR
jgi:hypothetical protein